MLGDRAYKMVPCKWTLYAHHISANYKRPVHRCGWNSTNKSEKERPPVAARAWTDGSETLAREQISMLAADTSVSTFVNVVQEAYLTIISKDD